MLAAARRQAPLLTVHLVRPSPRIAALLALSPHVRCQARRERGCAAVGRPADAARPLRAARAGPCAVRQCAPAPPHRAGCSAARPAAGWPPLLALKLHTPPPCSSLPLPAISFFPSLTSPTGAQHPQNPPKSNVTSSALLRQSSKLNPPAAVFLPSLQASEPSLTIFSNLSHMPSTRSTNPWWPSHPRPSAPPSLEQTSAPSKSHLLPMISSPPSRSCCSAPSSHHARRRRGSGNPRVPSRGSACSAR